MKVSKSAYSAARRIYKMCQVDGRLDEGRARTAIGIIVNKKPRDYRGMLVALRRLIRLEVERRNVTIQSAEPLSQEEVARVQASLCEQYGADLTFETSVQPDLLGGLKIRIGNDVFDGSVKARIERLTQIF